MKNKAIAGCMTVFIFGLVAGCGTSNNDSNSLSAQSSSAQPTLDMATSADNPPFEFVDTQSGGQIEGFDIDLTKLIAKDLGFKYSIQNMNFDGLIGALQSKRADFSVADMTPTPAREKNVDFSEVYYTDEDAIVQKAGENITSVSQFVGKKVGVQTGTVQEAELKAVKGVDIVSLDSAASLVEDLKTGRVNALLMGHVAAGGYLKNSPDLTMHLLPSSNQHGAAIAFPKGSKWVKPFNQELDKLKADGEMQVLINKWFGKDK